MLRESSYSHGNRNCSKTLAVVIKGETLHFGSQSVSPHDGILQRRVWQEDGELFATVSAANIAGTKKVSQQIGYGPEYSIARIMTKRVVKLFEVININQDDG